MVNSILGRFVHHSSRLGRTALLVAVALVLLPAGPTILHPTSAFASGPGSDHDDEFDADEFDSDAFEFDEQDDNDHDFDGPDDEDTRDDDSGDDFDNSGRGSGDDDDDGRHSGPASSDSRHSADDELESSDATAEAVDAVYSIEVDDLGNEYVAREILFIGTHRGLRLALARGFDQLRVQQLESGGVLALLAAPRDFNQEDALRWLSTSAPDALVTPNNVYRGAQSVASDNAPRLQARAPRQRGIIGVIDTGVDTTIWPRGNVVLSQRAFAGQHPVAREHGSMVAAIAISRGARVHVADVFGQDTNGAPAASAERIAAALDWMIARRVAVINISIEGPDNPVLAEMVRRATRRGHLIVAAAGNGGPNARPAYPAAYEGVLAITAIDATGRSYLRATRGAYIDFAAHGVDVDVAMGETTARVSGTSYAAPVIAAEAAALFHEPSLTTAAEVLADLRSRAEDLGAPGHDRVFGWGALGN